MTDLIDRLSGESKEHDPVRPKIPAHQFNAGLGLYVAGKITAAEAQQDFDLQGDELTQANALIAVYDGKNTTQKLIYHEVVKAVAYKMEHSEDTIYHNPDGTIDKAAVAVDLEIN